MCMCEIKAKQCLSFETPKMSHSVQTTWFAQQMKSPSKRPLSNTCPALRPSPSLLCFHTPISSCQITIIFEIHAFSLSLPRSFLPIRGCCGQGFFSIPCRDLKWICSKSGRYFYKQMNKQINVCNIQYWLMRMWNGSFF